MSRLRDQPTGPEPYPSMITETIRRMEPLMRVRFTMHLMDMLERHHLPIQAINEEAVQDSALHSFFNQLGAPNFTRKSVDAATILFETFSAIGWGPLTPDAARAERERTEGKARPPGVAYGDGKGRFA